MNNLADNNSRTLTNSIYVQIRVIGALMVREMLTTYGRKNLGFLWLFLEPLIFIFVIIMFKNLIFGSHIKGTISIYGFLLTGYVVFMLLRRAIGFVGSAAQSNRGILFHRNVKVMDLFYARFLLEFLSLSFVLIFLNFWFNFFNLMPLPNNFLKTSVGWIFLGFVIFSIGLILSYATFKIPILRRNRFLVLILIIPFSGVLTSLHWLPVEQREIISYVPVVHAMELFREGYFGNINAIYSINYFLFSSILIFFIGLVLAKKVRRNLEEAA
jgi:capsular polysaccharide transport system permease protein